MYLFAETATPTFAETISLVLMMVMSGLIGSLLTIMYQEAKAKAAQPNRLFSLFETGSAVDHDRVNQLLDELCDLLKTSDDPFDDEAMDFVLQHATVPGFLPVAKTAQELRAYYLMELRGQSPFQAIVDYEAKLDSAAARQSRQTNSVD